MYKLANAGRTADVSNAGMTSGANSMPLQKFDSLTDLYAIDCTMLLTCGNK